MSLGAWIWVYAVFGAITGMLVAVGSRKVDPVSSEGSELFLAIPALLIWPVVWIWASGVLIITMYRRKTTTYNDAQLPDL